MCLFSSEDRYDARRNGRGGPQAFSPRFGATAPPDNITPRFTTAQGPVEGSRGFGKRVARGPPDDKKAGGKDGGGESPKDDIVSPYVCLCFFCSLVLLICWSDQP